MTQLGITTILPRSSRIDIIDEAFLKHIRTESGNSCATRISWFGPNFCRVLDMRGKRKDNGKIYGIITAVTRRNGMAKAKIYILTEQVEACTK